MYSVLVLLATYNGEKYLKEQINSILAQKDIQVSILVRDDGSTDGTIGILKEYEGQKVLKWYSGEHLNVTKGYYELMQKSIEYPVEYIAFCDQDDVWDSDKLYVAVEHLAKIPAERPALYYCGQRLVDANRNFIADHVLNQRRSLRTRFVLSDFAGCTGVFNKSLLKEVTQYKPEYMLMHDTWILKVCLGLGGYVYVDPYPHMDYRQHGHNTVGLGRNWRSYVKQVFQYLNEYKVEPQMKELLAGYGDRIVPEYKEVAMCVCDYRSNKKSKRKLLKKSYIDFCNRGLNVTYKLKVLLNKL